jgi:hypothetical protein
MSGLLDTIILLGQIDDSVILFSSHFVVIIWQKDAIINNGPDDIIIQATLAARQKLLSLFPSLPATIGPLGLVVGERRAEVALFVGRPPLASMPPE